MINESEELKKYKEGLWAFMLEHSKILPSGTMRIIFDTDGRDNFYKRVWARVNHSYHREDYVSKEKWAIQKKEIFLNTKKIKKERYQNHKKERREKQHIIKAGMIKAERFNKKPEWQKNLLRKLEKILKKCKLKHR